MLLLDQIADKNLTRESLFKIVEQDFALVPLLLEGLASSKPAIRYTCARVLVDLSEHYPENLYPYVHEFFNLLNNDFRILKWNGLSIIANLATVDINNVFDDNFDRYFSLMNDGYMVTVANLVGFSSKIGLAKPYLANRIARELLKIENIALTPHLTEECKRIIAQQSIDTFDQLFNLLDKKLKVEVLDFVKKYLESSRPHLREKAKTFVLRWG